MRRALFAAVAGLMAAAVLQGPARAEEVRISVGSFNLNNLPFPLTSSLGFYEAEGLDVTTENFSSGGSKVLQALIAGSTDIAVGFYDHTIQMQAQNKDVVAVALLARNSGLVLAAGKQAAFDPARPETIKGARIGITAPGSSSDFFVRYYLDHHGLSAGDVSIIGVGSGASAVAALERGTVDLLANYDPAATLIEERGAGRIVIDARTDAGAETVYGGIYPTSVLYTTRQFLEQNPETVQKVVNATVKTLRWMDAHSAEEIYDKVPSDYVVGERASYVAAIAHAKTLFSPDGRFDPATLETPLRVLRQFNEAVQAAPIDLSRTYTNAFIDKALAQYTQ